MAEHRLTDYTATITWLGLVPEDRANIRSGAAEAVEVTYAGFTGEHHAGLTRPACVRVKSRHAQGTEIRNTRQMSIVSAEEMAQIAAQMELEALEPQHLGASIVVEGIPDFTLVPPASRLQAENGTTLVIDVENGPCNLPAREIDKNHPGSGKTFRSAARGRRGVTAWVEREGRLKVGDRMRLFVPDQPLWPHV
ncbi:MAG: MOSC domain-containing protein [Pseudomonadota bacterium]